MSYIWKFGIERKIKIEDFLNLEKLVLYLQKKFIVLFKIFVRIRQLQTFMYVEVIRFGTIR